MNMNKRPEGLTCSLHLCGCWSVSMVIHWCDVDSVVGVCQQRLQSQAVLAHRKYPLREQTSGAEGQQPGNNPAIIAQSFTRDRRVQQGLQDRQREAYDGDLGSRKDIRLLTVSSGPPSLL